MTNPLIWTRNMIIRFLYKVVLKPIFFLNDPEKVHDFMINFGKFLGNYRFFQKPTSLFFNYKNPVLKQKILGIDFKNPLGLSAGFDKNAELTGILPYVGFGFTELGSITGEPCEGNPKPRLWRLPESGAIVVNYGLKNDGCEVISKRLEGKEFVIPTGISVAMTNCDKNINIDNAITDYTKAFEMMEPLAQYITVNISCPNAKGGQPFLIAENLEKLLLKLDEIPTNKPIFVKLAPDLDYSDIDKILDVLKKHRVQGIVCTNLTKKREGDEISRRNIPNVGGISGKAVKKSSDDLISYIYKKEKNNFIIIGSGGIFTAVDAYKKIRLGASLLQIITGMIFEGPQSISEINRGLVALLRKDGFSNINQAIGADIC